MSSDEEMRTSFLTDQGTYYFHVMSFDMKNARETYKSLVSEIFKPYNSRDIEVYVDDMLVKSSVATNLMWDL